MLQRIEKSLGLAGNQTKTPQMSSPQSGHCTRYTLKGHSLLVMRCHIILTGHWCDTVVLNVHSSADTTNSDAKDSFCDKPEAALINFLSITCTFC